MNQNQSKSGFAALVAGYIVSLTLAVCKHYNIDPGEDVTSSLQGLITLGITFVLHRETAV